MTGMYQASLSAKRKEMNRLIGNLNESLASLQNQDSNYAHEHRLLLDLYQRVLDIYLTAADGEK